MSNGIRISELSVRSLLLHQYFNDSLIGSATGFVAESTRGPVLITNRHVVTGRHQDTNEPLSSTAAVPNRIEIFHNRPELGRWDIKSESLYDDADEPLWIEHPRYRGRVDVIALPLTQLNEIRLYPYDVHNVGASVSCSPAETVSVIGFPFGLQGGGSLAIWATGFIASEPDIDYGNLPVLLIDCRSRQGQSGSPVVACRRGAVAMEGGETAISSGQMTRLLGVYSGRINSESDLGKVWKIKAVSELVNSIIPATSQNE